MTPEPPPVVFSLTETSATPTPAALTEAAARAAERLARRQARQPLLDDFRRILAAANDPVLDTGARLEHLLALHTLIIPQLFEELLEDTPNEARSVVAARTLAAARDMAQLLLRKRESEAAAEFSVRNPKVQVVFGWLIELFHTVTVRHTTNDGLIANIFGDLTNELAGWEDRVERRLRATPVRLLKTLDSPFVETLREQLADAAKEAPAHDPATPAT